MINLLKSKGKIFTTARIISYIAYFLLIISFAPFFGLNTEGSSMFLYPWFGLLSLFISIILLVINKLFNNNYGNNGSMLKLNIILLLLFGAIFFAFVVIVMTSWGK